MAPVLVPGGVAFCGLLGAGPAFGRDRVQKLRQTATSRGKRTQNAHRSAGKARRLSRGRPPAAESHPSHSRARANGYLDHRADWSAETGH